MRVMRAPGSAPLLISVSVTVGDRPPVLVEDRGVTMISGLEPGVVTAEASDPTPGCDVVDENPKSVEIVTAQISTLSFTLDCEFVPVRRIAYSAPAGGSASNVWTVRAGGGELRQLTTNNLGYIPDWAPDGTRIAYWGPGGGVWVMNFDGNEQRTLSSTLTATSRGPCPPSKASSQRGHQTEPV